MYHNLADYFLRSGLYKDAEQYYRKAIDIQNSPRYTDSFEALAQFYEIRRDYPAALSAVEELLDVFNKEWNFITGETADIIRREISRIKDRY